MKVYKFGGASIKDARGIRNLAQILSKEQDDIWVVISAIGKTTNALEQVVETHRPIIEDLHLDLSDTVYDAFVSMGELQSTRIVSAYLTSVGIANTWLDATHMVVTDSNHRSANVLLPETRERVREAVESRKTAALKVERPHCWVTQGFIGGTQDGEVTTLGREGSDYSAAVFANVLDAESVTVWKDVPGILTADPRRYSEAQLIQELNYEDAIRLAQSGAQIIHPKTIEPLRQKGIPLYVKPFFHPSEPGTCIHAQAPKLTIPVMWGK